jgi:hypothetical protein
MNEDVNIMSIDCEREREREREREIWRGIPSPCLDELDRLYMPTRTTAAGFLSLQCSLDR